MSNVKTTEKPEPFISNNTYDRLKWIAQIGLPTLATLYFALGGIWGFPNVEEVVGTITALDLALGALLGLSSKNFNTSGAKYDGALVVDTTNEDRDIYSLEVHSPFESLREKDELTIKVQRPTDDGSQ